MRIARYIFSFFFFIFSSLSNPASAQVVEWITFLKEDGLHYTEYQTIRSDAPTYFLAYEKNKSLKKITKEIFYIFPNSYRFDTESDPNINKLQFPEGSYAILKSGKLNNVTIGSDGIYTYRTWDGKKYPNEHYGLSNFGKGFEKAAAAWVFPENLEIVDYECNKAGKWVRRGNTIAYFGTNVNNLTFKLRFRPRARSTYDALKVALKGVDQILLEQKDLGTKIVLKNTILFFSGSITLSDSGKTILSKIIEILKKRDLQIIIEGHTDNVPINEKLRKVFPTNWELSSARMLTVLRHLVGRGIPQKLLEARAFSFTRPRGSNDTPEGRRENRRIEIYLVDRSKNRN